jgi:sugar lactone lactonase YvrE
MSAAAPGGVFISYRRQEASGLAGRLYDRLADRFGDDQVFMDVDTIALGVDFAEVITQALSTCQVLLAVIGPHWLTATDQDGRRRLDDPDDIVRLEIAAALERDIHVIPILIEGAQMPRRQELPENLASLARRNALSVRHESFRADAERLLAAIEPVLRAAPPVSSRPARAVQGAVDPADVVPFPSAIQVLRHDNNVNGVAFSPDGRLLATASTDKTARIWEVANGQEHTRVTHDGAVVEAVAFSPDGRLLATAGHDQTARIWGLTSGQQRTRITHEGAVFAVAFSPDGRLLATASHDQTARVWEVASGQERTRVTHDTYQRVVGVAFSPDGRLLATASTDNTARIWEVANGEGRSWVTHQESVRDVTFSPDGRLLATASFDDSAGVWALIR